MAPNAVVRLSPTNYSLYLKLFVLETSSTLLPTSYIPLKSASVFVPSGP